MSDYDSDSAVSQVASDGGGGDDEIRDDLAQVAFEDILKMRDKLGTKIYRESVLKKLDSSASAARSGQVIEPNESKDDESDDDGDDDHIPLLQTKKKKKGNPNLQFKRQQRSAPIEATSKRLDYRHNFALLPTTSGSVHNRSARTQNVTKPGDFRDPRFDQKCGTFQDAKFDQNYHFLKDMRQQELDTLKGKLRKAKTDEAKERLGMSIQILQNQLRTTEHKEKNKQVERRVKQTVASIKELDKVQQGQQKMADIPKKAPKVLVNKPTLKRAQLAEKFKELKSSGKLDKYLEKKRKKNASKDRRLLNKRI